MSSPVARPALEGGNEYEKALLFGGLIIAAMLSLVFLRWMINVILDVCCLDNGDQVCHDVKEFWRKMCPWWHVRTATADEGDVEAVSTPSACRDSHRDLFDAVLHRRRKGDCLTDPCPICLHEIEPSEWVATVRCDHAFHSQCITDWLSSSKTDCPICRTELISRLALLRIQDNQSTTRRHNS